MKLLTVVTELALVVVLVVACAPKTDATDVAADDAATEPAPAEEAAPAEAEAEAAPPVDPAQEKQALELTCAAFDAAAAEPAEGAEASGQDFHAAAEASLAEAGLSMDIGVLGEIANASAEDKTALLAAAVERHGLQEACAGLSGEMASHPEPAAEGSADEPAAEGSAEEPAATEPAAE